jgi:hypothetical protein
MVMPTDENKTDVDKIQALVQQNIALKNKKNEKSFKDAIFLEGS